jgi:hypothetical protein
MDEHEMTLDKHKLIGYCETENGSRRSKCCGNCGSGGGKVGLDPDRPNVACSYCFKHEVLVCLTNGTCPSFHRKKK